MHRGFVAGVLWFAAALAAGWFGGERVWAAEGAYKVAALGEGVPAEVAGAVKELMEAKGVRVSGADGKVLAEVWLRKEVPTDASFAASQAVKYPIVLGHLVGVVRFPAVWSDFRGQKVKAGVYTLRYMLQPEDGNHLGTALQRDFLLLSPAAKDTKTEAQDYDTLSEGSMKAAGTAHPAIMMLVPAEPPAPSGPAIEHVEEGDLWVLGLKARGKAGELPLKVVVVGKAAE